MKWKNRFSCCLPLCILLFPLFVSAEEEVAPPNTLGGVLEPALGIDFKRTGKVPGTVNVRIVNNRFEVWFLDEEGLIVEPDFETGVMFYSNPNIKELRNLHTTVSRSDSQPILTSPLIIAPPHRYLVRLVLSKEAPPPDIYQPQVPGQEKPAKIEEIYGQAVLNQLVQQDAADEESPSVPGTLQRTSGGGRL